MRVASFDCTITYRPKTRVWEVVTPHHPNGLQFATENNVRTSGAPGLFGAISWCLLSAAGRPGTLIITQHADPLTLLFEARETRDGTRMG